MASQRLALEFIESGTSEFIKRIDLSFESCYCSIEVDLEMRVREILYSRDKIVKEYLLK